MVIFEMVEKWYVVQESHVLKIKVEYAEVKSTAYSQDLGREPHSLDLPS